MNGKRRIAIAGFQLALGGMLGCSASDPNTIIGSAAGSANTAGGTAGAAASSAGASSTVAGAPSGGMAGQSASSGAGGAVAGSGGMSTTAGTGGSGGNSGSGGGGESAGAPSICTPSGSQFDCNDVLKGMDGYTNQDPADGPSSGSDAHQFNCTDTEAAPVVFKQQHWQLTGPGITMGAPYKVALHFYGVVECKTYIGGSGPATNDSMVVSPTVSHDLWFAGAKDNGDHWNTYAFTVTPASSAEFAGMGSPSMPPDAAHSYVINQCPGTHIEDHYTWRIDYDTSITVPGGSFINYIEYDTNCRMIANCGAADAAQSCDGPYNIVNSVTNAVPNTNAGFSQPLQNDANPPSRGQWWLVDVTGITAM
jgi:hypothetical protein